MGDAGMRRSAGLLWAVLTVASLAICLAVTPINQKHDHLVELGDHGADVTEATKHTYKHYLAEALTALGATHKQISALTETEQLGESNLAPRDDDTNDIRRKAMITAIKILEMENQRKKLVAENT